MQSVQQDFGPVLSDVGYRYTYWTPLVLVATKIKPLSVQHGFPLSSNHIKQGMGTQECEDRCVTLELESVYLVCAYVPNSGRGMDRRRAWNEAFATFLRSLDLKKPVIWTGDFNVVGELDTSRDLSKIDPKPPGATLEEWQAHQALLDPLPGTKPWRPGYHKFVDIWRLMNGNKRDGFTFRNDKWGSWRLDGFVMSERFTYNVRKCEPRPEVNERYHASDHWPVWLSLEIAPVEL